MSTLWKTDDELFNLSRKELFTAVVGDIMDQLGLVHQFLSPKIQPLCSKMVTIGRAMTVLEIDDCSGNGPNRKSDSLNKPFGLMLEALDDLKKNEVYICTGSSPQYALWGELMSTRALKLGAVGAVVDGYSRDTRGILALDFPCFSYGRYAQDQAPRGKVVDFRCDLKMNGVLIRSGDIVFGDIDGVCIIPQEREEEIFLKSFEKARGEKIVAEAIRSGMSCREAWDRFQIM